MKAIIITTAATVLSLIISALLIYFLLIRNKKTPKWKIAVAFVLSWVLCFFIGAFAYFGSYYHATDNALSYLNSTDEVSVNPLSYGYYFDGPGEGTAMIFYPGAKVEESAYAGVMYSLAEQGIDCFLVKMPLHMAFMGKDRADVVINEFGDDYENWYMAGHSLGGSMAAVYTVSHPYRDIKGLIFMASYSPAPVSDGVKVLSILGSEDKVMSWDEYYSNLANLPEGYTEVEISGGNHGQFGDYGIQNGDGAAFISMEEQQRISVDEIIKFVFNN